MKSSKGVAGSCARRLGALAIGCMMLAPLGLVAQETTAPPPAAGPQQGTPGPGMNGRPGPGRMQQRQLEMMTRELNLTPEQADQVKGIQADSMKQMMAVRDDSSVKPEDRRAKMMEIRQSTHEKIRGLLTDEQKTKFDAMQSRMGGPRGPNGPAAPVQSTPPPPQQ